MRKVFVDTLIKLARNDKDIVLITSDMGFSVLEPFFKKFPSRAINCGIAEQNAVSIASGLALLGKKPYVYTIIPFLVATPDLFKNTRPKSSLNLVLTYLLNPH